MLCLVKIIEASDAPGFAKWLKAAVDRSGKRAEVIAVKAEISTSYIYRLMGDRAKTVSRDVVTRLEKVLGVKYLDD